MLDVGCRVTDAGSGMLDVGCLVTDAGCLMSGVW
jgi:hypothetical protein